MGDCADIALEDVETMEFLRLEYRLGINSPQVRDNLEELIEDEGTWNRPRHTKSIQYPEMMPPVRKQFRVTCRYCQTGGLRWKETPEGWRLFSGEELHCCRVALKLAAEGGGFPE